MKSIWKKNKKKSFLSTHSPSTMTVFPLPKTFCNEINSDAKILVGWPKRKRKKNSLDIQTVREIDLITLPLSQKNLYTTIYIYRTQLHVWKCYNETRSIQHRSNQPLKRLYTKLSNHTLWIVAILKLNSLTKTVFNNLKTFESIVGPLTIGVRANATSRIYVTKENTYSLD